MIKNEVMLSMLLSLSNVRLADYRPIGVCNRQTMLDNDTKLTVNQ